nr:ABC transporter G family member 11 [Ipomoea batatas]
MESRQSVFNKLGSSLKEAKRKYVHERLGLIPVTKKYTNSSLGVEPLKEIKSVALSRMGREVDINILCGEVLKLRISLDEGLRQWRQYAHIGSQSKATFPTNPVTPKKHHSSKYKAWLQQVNDNLLEDHISKLITLGNPSTSKGEVIIEHHMSKEAQSLNQIPFTCDEENNEELNSIKPSNSLEKVQKKTPSVTPQVLRSTPQASIFQSRDYFILIYKTFVASFWRTIRETLSAAQIDEISSLKESIEKNIQLMKRDGVDLSVLEQRVPNFFERVQDYDQIHSKTLEATSQKIHDSMLTSVQDALTKTQEEYSKSQELLLDHRRALADSNGQQDDLEITIKDAKKLIKRSKAKLKEIHDQKQQLEALITEA